MSSHVAASDRTESYHAAVAASRRRAALQPDPRQPTVIDGEKAKDPDANPAPAPLGTAGFFSRLLFLYMTPMVNLSRKTRLELKDVHNVEPWMESRNAMADFHREWDVEIQSKGKAKASLVRTLYRTYKRPLLIAWAYIFAYSIFALLGPAYFFRELILFSDTDDTSVAWGVFLALGFMASDSMRSLTAHQYWVDSAAISSMCRNLIFGLVYEKAVSLRDLSGYTVGQLVNMCANDAQRVYDAGQFFVFIPVAIIMGSIVLVVSVLLVGWPALVGCGIFVLMIPLQSAFAKFTAKLRRRAIKSTDRRVRMMSEILTSIKLIKMYAWERPFAAEISRVRQHERRTLQKAAYAQSSLGSLIPTVPLLAGALTFIVRFESGGNLTAADVFTILAMFNMLRFLLSLAPRGVKSGSEALIGFERLKKFLMLEDRLPDFLAPDDASLAIDITDGRFAWGQYDKPAPAPETANGGKAAKGDAQPSSEAGKPTAAEQPAGAVTALSDINFRVKTGSVIGICGGVGSGKSSLLSAVLGQMKIEDGGVRLRGSPAYVSQQAWIQSDTLENNILFNKPKDEARYQAVLDACCLLPDLEILPAGDQTEIGERGINLSGGQKQRVSLARALYSNDDVYLLDDPLSAVDAHVGKRLFNGLVLDALASKTVLFVTHQLQYLNRCDQVVYMRDGRIAESGGYADLMAADQGFAELVHSREQMDADSDSEGEESATKSEPGAATATEPTSTTTTDASTKPATTPSPTASASASASASKEERAEAVRAGKELVQAESRQKGAVTWRTYVKYGRAGGGLYLALLILMLFILGVAAKAFSDIFLGYWVSQGDGTNGSEGNLQDHEDRDLFVLIYGMSAVGLIVVQVIRAVFYNIFVLKSSSRLHAELFLRVAKAPMSFFDSTPTGRILNRFSKDMDDVDVSLPQSLEPFLLNIFILVAVLAIVAWVFPFFLVAILPVVFFYSRLVRSFRPTQREVKRLDNITRSPVFSHLTSTLQGLPTVHAFRREREFTDKFFRALDRNTRPFFAFYVASHWFALRLDCVTTLMTGTTALFIVFLKDDVEDGRAGLALLYIAQASGVLQFTTRLSAEIEARFTSVERITNYIADVPVEAPAHIAATAPAAGWPAQGGVVFEDVTVRYRPQLPPVLSGVSFAIEGSQKVGVCGRTGAGKSTIANVLFRILELDGGRVLVDGVDIAALGLDDLRSRLSIIPQDPVLFVGTIRYNLDPFGEHSDAAVWSALERAHVRDMVARLPQALHSQVVENGENFSVGERQLLCMARALLRNSKILVLDEATAAIDSHTDAKIQATIREAFADCTLLTVAHRLNTIIDSDRILVLDAGRVVEYAAPRDLLADPASAFSALVRASNDEA